MDLPLHLGRRVRLNARRLFSEYPRYYIIEWNHRLSALFNRRTGVTSIKRKPPLIVSLTTIPERISSVYLCIDSILRQSLKPDYVFIWLSPSTDPARPEVSENHLPASLLRLIGRGLSIHWCDDIGPHTKLIPTMIEHPDALVVTSDDDCLYPRDWLRDLYEAYLAEPEYIHCHRAHLMTTNESGALTPYHKWDFCAPGYIGPSARLFPTGTSGVLYAPGHLDKEVFNLSAIKEICTYNDDVWFKAMSLKAGVLCKKVRPYYAELPIIRGSQKVTLGRRNRMRQGGNDSQIKAVYNKYDLISRLGD